MAKHRETHSHGKGPAPQEELCIAVQTQPWDMIRDFALDLYSLISTERMIYQSGRDIIEDT